MKIIRIWECKMEDILKLAADIVKKGGVLIIPTDTVYGLVSDPYDSEAVERVFKIKNRRRDKPLPILVDSLESALNIGFFTAFLIDYAKTFWPGPFTMIVRLRDNRLTKATAGLNKVGLRKPDNAFAIQLAKLVGGALVGTSANISGGAPPRNLEEALKQLDGKVDLAIDGGPVRYGFPSTIVDFTLKPPRIVRDPLGLGPRLNL